jgi:hypothetical protein
MKALQAGKLYSHTPFGRTNTGFLGNYPLPNGADLGYGYAR